MIQFTGMLVFAFLLGSLPFSVWLGRLALHGKDVRQVGDRNPGAINTMRAGGWKLGILVLVLDVAKGALPVGLAYQVLGFEGVQMWCIAMAPVLGHAFSPFLGWQGGKALAVTLGTWIGLALHVVALPILLVLVFWYALLAVDGWAVMFTGATILIGLLVLKPDPLFLAVLTGDLILLAWTHRADLHKRIELREWVRRKVPIRWWGP